MLAISLQVCGLIHTIRHHYLAALDSYMKDVDEPVHAFSFINDALLQLIDDEYASFRSAVISRIPELLCLSRYARCYKFQFFIFIFVYFLKDLCSPVPYCV